ncbi:MAG: DUF3343 domain-containing protein [Tepidanaerobacteraceae bacterium]|nr:DUF3343 domain-containing protein [Tepidanaerobacteraceae bacterium]
MKYIATFYTHSGAVKYRRYMERKNIDIELMPVPRELSSNCGIGAQFMLDEDIRLYISEDIEKLFQITQDGYKLMLEN